MYFFLNGNIMALTAPNIGNEIKIEICIQYLLENTKKSTAGQFSGSKAEVIRPPYSQGLGCTTPLLLSWIFPHMVNKKNVSNFAKNLS